MNTTIMTEEVTIEHIKSYAEQTLYRMSLLADYSLTHKKNGKVNKYQITAEVRGLQGGSIWLEVVSVEHSFYFTTYDKINEETLADKAVKDLFDSNIR